jgi:hypothetical protein
MLKKCAREAGIDKPVNPHNFRHTTVTRLKKAGFTNEEIRQFTGWTDDRMFDRYDHTTNRERNDRIRVKAGLLEEAETDTGPLEPVTCTNCNQKLKPTVRFCPNCGFGVTPDAHLKSMKLEDQLFESATTATGDLAQAVLELRSLLNETPGLREILLDE